MFKQKSLLWISWAMFVVPEVMFGAMVSVLFLLIGKDYNSLVFLPGYNQFFSGHPSYITLLLVIEALGIIGLLFWNLQNKHSKIFTILLVLFLLAVISSLVLGYGVTHISF